VSFYAYEFTHIIIVIIIHLLNTKAAAIDYVTCSKNAE